MAPSSAAGRRWATYCALILALLAVVVVLLAAGAPETDRTVSLTAVPLADPSGERGLA